ncbi:hypothetical protein F01_420187 [Burkholderia cenocepacia]|nr:hypothetical protein F01_420187 [Burkholderia cenocepacia]
MPPIQNGHSHILSGPDSSPIHQSLYWKGFDALPTKPHGIDIRKSGCLG